MCEKTPQFKGLAPSSEHASKNKKQVRSKDTAAELLLRRELWKRGFRYRVHVSGLPGKPDLVFPRQRLVVFCDGDFWHGRDWEKRRTRLKAGSNASYWVAKILSNINRDLRQTAALEAEGWTVLRVWETDIKRSPSAIADQVSLALQPR
jgi:DNA mismatch endonuclease (patch repair protein)